MATYKSKVDHTAGEEGAKIAQVLDLMVLDDAYMTQPSFSANSEKYTDNLIPFTDKHMAYLRNHPATDPEHYISNLKLMTKIRR